jgi:hypothetical protein
MGGRVVKTAEVSLGTSDFEGTWRALLYYGADGTSTFTGLMPVTATLDGRTGTFVLAGSGTYDGTTARMTLEIVPGSGTDGLSGISGQADHASTHADTPQWPLVLTYQLG